MELSKNYIPNEIEAKWYEHWLDKKYFNSTPDNREPYTIVMPPPNVTGVLHMGHCLNNTIQDILIRRARMQGKNACWVPGTDHASIATEAKVVQMLRERGINKSTLSRDEFLAYAWEWKEKYGGIILQQLKKLGCSLDWNRVNFTMDDDYYQSVIKVFIDLHNKGLIYRGKRMINWDVKAKTALSDEEVIHKEVQSKLYYIKYYIDEGNTRDAQFDATHITIATVRPETILGDTAICVHPNDERYLHLHGKYALIPLINRRIPIIADEYITMDFGTGALKVTPAHDINDYNLAKKHNLEVIDIMNDDGTLNNDAQLYIGEDRMDVRKKIAKQLEEEGYLEKAEDYTNQVGFSERTDAVVEPRLSLQWWVSMKKMSEPALKSVVEDAIKFYPPKFKNLYRYWMENIKDWCISRQLWWGHRIPAWYDAEGRFVVAANESEAKEIFNKQYSISNAQLKQDEDVLDTWFSSWLWPFEVFKGLSKPGNAEIKYYYPTNTLVTAPEIIFFWVARMIMAGFEWMDEKPFSEVYFTGIVRDKLGRKMSKSLGNSPDLLGLIDKYGADAVRFGIMISSPAGNDLLFDEGTLEQGRNFNNKLWNALKLVKMWEGRKAVDNKREATDNFAIEWFENRLNEVRKEVDELMKQFRLSEALKTIYSLIWDDFCSWYLEWIKPGFEQPIEASVYNKTIDFFDELMQLLHPFMPFITEEIYHIAKERTSDLTIKQQLQITDNKLQILEQGELLKKVITAIRDARNKNQIKPKDLIQLHIQTASTNDYKAIEQILSKQVNAQSVAFVEDTIANTIVVAVEKDKFYIGSEKELDSASLKDDLLKDLAHQKGFLESVLKKLSNERFVQNAKPEVVALEKKKQADAEARIRTIEESLAALN
ncbi:valine--tRNA ligase [Ferruginibacter albus]|uniref:valine--tRNA ligase n=1 Tax=Ferruginibacter albus TaxID=2875540 RepID=UPI001CC58858|nr:valine--tRNA ligase [Ferruginibacter albus]UAY50803.1 valine--tRNA ligase [Ferruginibacter albus]